MLNKTLIVLIITMFVICLVEDWEGITKIRIFGISLVIAYLIIRIKEWITKN